MSKTHNLLKNQKKGDKERYLVFPWGEAGGNASEVTEGENRARERGVQQHNVGSKAIGKEASRLGEM